MSLRIFSLPRGEGQQSWNSPCHQPLYCMTPSPSAGGTAPPGSQPLVPRLGPPPALQPCVYTCQLLRCRIPPLRCPTSRFCIHTGNKAPGSTPQTSPQSAPTSTLALRLGTHSQRCSNQRPAALSCCGVTPIGLYGSFCSITPTTPRVVGAMQMQPNTNPMRRCNSKTGQHDSTAHRSTVCPRPKNQPQGFTPYIYPWDQPPPNQTLHCVVQ